MVNFLNLNDIGFEFYGNVPVPEEHKRGSSYIVFYKNGTCSYRGRNAYYDALSYERLPPIEIDNLKPNEEILDTVINKLKHKCREQAKANVINRLIDHEFKLNGLDLLIGNV